MSMSSNSYCGCICNVSEMFIKCVGQLNITKCGNSLKSLERGKEKHIQILKGIIMKFNNLDQPIDNRVNTFCDELMVILVCVEIYIQYYLNHLHCAS